MTETTDDLVKRLRDGCSCNIDSSPCMAEEECRDAYAAADRIEALEAKLAKAVEAGVDVAASLSATISILERGGKKAAASDKMFAQMLVDYNESLNRFRATLAELTGGQKNE